MSPHGAVAAFAARESRQELRDPASEVDGDGDDRTQLDDDRIHLPISAAEVDAEQRFTDAQVRRRRDRQKLGQSFDDAEYDGEKVGVHSGVYPKTGMLFCNRYSRRTAS